MDEGFIRPEAKILPKESLVPTESLIQPPPNRFTHETIARTPFSYAGAHAAGGREDGALSAGTKVVLLRADRDGDQASVVDGSGLYVVVPTSSLRPLGEAQAIRRSASS
jgi:hypothetical protein